MLKPDLNPLVVFIHGLNTFKDSNFHAGPLTLGPMSASWRIAIESQGWDFLSVRDIGFDSFDVQIERVLEQLGKVLDGVPETGSAQVGRSRDGSGSPRVIHLLGHSMGGLIARGVAARLATDSRVSVRSVITIGTPHNGTLAAGDALDLRVRAPRLYRILARLGYDIETRREHFRHLQRDRILEFARAHPSVERGYSLIGAVTFGQLGFPFQIIYKHLHPQAEPSDGIVWAENQKWAEVLGEFELDHFGQIGAFWSLSPRVRARARREFSRAVRTVQDVIRTNSV